nr:hypothetical protein BaRGS_009488 [Batillaria attramentaria]
MMVNQPHPNDEVVKCVVVGDSGVGKTCLVCAWACNAQYDLKKLVKTHVATVWAIDHYQRDIEVLERSWCEVDGVRVSLRLWDTFGYHDKDRRFAYRGADVVLLCFSTVRPSSLRNVKTIWYPEIRRFCPTTPIILAGTQTDLRYLYNDDDYLKLEKGLMYKDIHEADIVTPAMGHEVAKDIGAPFYESSVLTKFGVSDIFINSVRAALIERRKLKFWNTQLRRVQRPLIQQPVLHNANQLTRWCERFLSIHYRELTQMFGKLFRSLPKENQDAIEKKRWPPVWHLKEMERYERQTHDRFSYPAQRQRQDYNRCFSGCLCFSRRARHRLNDPVDLPM